MRVKCVWSLTGGAVSVAVLLRADVGPVVVGLVQIIVFLLEELKQRLRLLSPRVACNHGNRDAWCQKNRRTHNRANVLHGPASINMSAITPNQTIYPHSLPFIIPFVCEKQQYFPSFPHTFSRITVWRHSKKCWTVFPFVHNLQKHTHTHTRLHACYLLGMFCSSVLEARPDHHRSDRDSPVSYSCSSPSQTPSLAGSSAARREREKRGLNSDGTFIYTTTERLHRNKQKNATIVKRIWFSFKQKTIESLFSSVQFSVDSV